MILSTQVGPAALARSHGHKNGHKKVVKHQASRGAVLWGSNFENGHLGIYKTVRKEGGGLHGSHVITTERARTGRRSMKITVPADPSRHTADRYQLAAGMPNGVDGDERWYGFSMALGHDWNLRQIKDNRSYFFSVFGFRYSGPSTNGPGGNLDADLIGGAPRFLIGSNLSGAPGADHVGEAMLGTVVKGRWMDFVVHIKWSRGGDGLREVWRNGVKARSYHGRTLGIGAPFEHRIGLYQGVGVEHTRTLYVDNHRVGTSYAAVDPSR